MATRTERWRQSSLTVHETSDQGVRRRMPLAFADRTLWGRLILEFGCVYAEFERLLQLHSDDEHVAVVLPALLPAIRGDAFVADAKFFLGSDHNLVMLPATQEYVKWMQSLGSEDPKQLLVVAYTMIAALLAGGQIIRSFQRTAMGLAADEGGSIFSFDGKGRSLLAEIKTKLDSLQVSAQEEETFLSTKGRIFSMNDRLIEGCFLAHPPPVLRTLLAALPRIVFSRYGAVASAVVAVIAASGGSTASLIVAVVL
eukprot:CAMPEP_0204382476 /NCGR_PEP_ID=MMETSP0469-20131031/55144_1 /ASSEMBLY_ACC=CAM_ASM_000384 /TAXON_ID=2969 /ORGANISM="Oxyrrhis marina" /LENGTH=254 /DNA_ID=CAMNT_0051374563 /DNA_START=29 /DNA_END=788 /DNA_ORIENTATION=-